MTQENKKTKKKNIYCCGLKLQDKISVKWPWVDSFSNTRTAEDDRTEVNVLLV